MSERQAGWHRASKAPVPELDGSFLFSGSNAMDTAVSESESLFAELWKDLRDCESLDDIQNFQSKLFEETMHIQLSIRHCRRSIQETNKLREGVVRKRKHSKGAKFIANIYGDHANDLKELLQECEAQLLSLQLLGDTLAWQIFPRHVIRSFFRDESPGYFVDKMGTIHELDIVEELKSDSFVFMHDLTSVVREFDLSIHGGDYDGVLIEAKTAEDTSNNIRAKRQEKRAQDAVDYIDTGTRQLENGFTLLRISHELQESYEWEAIVKCLIATKVNDLAVTRSCDGLAVYIGATSDGLDSMSAETGLFDQLVSEAKFKRGTIPEDILNIPKNSPLMPLTTSTIIPELVVDLLFRRLFLFVSIDVKAIKDILRSKNIVLKTNSKGTKATLIGPNNIRLEMGTYQYERMIHEGLSPSSFIAICIAQFDDIESITNQGDDRA